METLEKISRALEIPIYQFFYNGDKPPIKKPKIPKGWGSSGHDARTLERLRRLLRRMKTRDLDLLMTVAQRMIQKK
jgi:hypothetical protein